MLLPVQCFTCGKVMRNGYWDGFHKMVSEGQKEEDALDRLGLKRDCCRTVILEHVDLADKLMFMKQTEQDEQRIHEPVQGSQLRHDTVAHHAEFNASSGQRT